jgi:acyl-CoA thioester hydrolase
MLRVAGIDQRNAFANGEGVYAVADLTIRYRRPARFDDALVIVSTVEHLRAAACVIQQRVMLGDELMADAKVTAAFITPDGRPRRQPPAWMDAFQRLLPESPDMIEESN